MKASPNKTKGCAAMKSILVFTAAILSTVSVAAASVCLEVENDLDRLTCYDREAGRTPVVEAVDTQSKWRVNIETSKMTDDTNVFMFLESNENVNCGWNGGQTISLIVRCMENTTAVYFSTGCHMTSSRYNNYGDVTYRLDDQKSKTKRFQDSTDNKALGLWRGSLSIPFLKEMLGKQKMLVRMTPYGESAFTAEFDISNIEKEIEPLRKSCGW